MKTILRNKMLFLGLGLLVVLFVVAGCQTQEVSQVDKGSMEAPTAVDSAKKNPESQVKTEVVEPVKEVDNSEVEEVEQNEVAVDEEGSENVKPATSTSNVTSTTKATADDEDVTIIKITATGFVPQEVTIKAGDTVRWVNERSGRLTKAMVLGNRECVAAKSPIFGPGGTYEFTFTSPMRCTVTEGITTKQVGMVIVQ